RMKRLHKFLHLPPTERWLLVKAALLLGAIRMGLWLLPFQTLKHLLACVSQASKGLHRANRPSADRIVWAVMAARRYVLRARPCLTQALAVQVLLKRRGYPAHLRIGVARTGTGQLRAHAWVESQDRVVLGGGEISRYTALPALERERQ
ncbi:MAG: lasso peptide biosynthesis B2 protein, partial [Candidatus Binatia bacterium]